MLEFRNWKVSAQIFEHIQTLHSILNHNSKQNKKFSNDFPQITTSHGEVSADKLRSTLEHIGRKEISDKEEQIVTEVTQNCDVTNYDFTTCEDGAKLYRCIDNVVKRLTQSTSA